MNEQELEKSGLEVEIYSYKFNSALGTFHDEDERKEQKRRLWKLNIINRKEDDNFLKEMGLKGFRKRRLRNKMTIIPKSKQKCLNMSREHNSLAYYCDECLEEVREVERERILKLIDEIEAKLEKEKGWKYIDALEELKQEIKGTTDLEVKPK